MKLDMCTEQSLDPDPTIPRSRLVISPVSRRVCELKGDPVRGCTVIVFTLWEGWGLRGRERESGVLVTEAVLGGWVYCTM